MPSVAIKLGDAALLAEHGNAAPARWPQGSPAPAMELWSSLLKPLQV
ncbi:MAG: hypothetical protein WDN31_14925 [Hyphomicrobium sp.]